MKERTCPFCGAIALGDLCERCGLEMPELAKTLSEKSPNLKKDLTPIESYEMYKTKKKSNSFFTTPFNESQVASQIRNYFMKYIDFKPYSFGKLFQNRGYEHFSLSPGEFVTFSLHQEFRYRNKQEIFDMDYENAFGMVYLDKFHLLKKIPLTQPLEDTISLLDSANIKYTVEQPSKLEYNEKTLKTKIRETTTQRIDYVGNNGQTYEKNLIPNLRNIIIHKHGIEYLWECFVTTKFSNNSGFKVKIVSGEIDPDGSFAQKMVTCKICAKFEDFRHKKKCSLCKSNLCYDCAEEKKIFKFFKRSYCPECVENGIKKDKNKIRLGLILAIIALGVGVSFFLYVLSYQ